MDVIGLLSQVQAASVLFVDNPVGTGFSYTEKPDGYATNVAMVASDMLVLLKNFFDEKTEFQVCQMCSNTLRRACDNGSFWHIECSDVFDWIDLIR